MGKLSDFNINKFNTIIKDQYAYGNSTDVVIEHVYTADNPRGKWKYFGGCIWDTVPQFESLNELIDFLENK